MAKYYINPYVEATQIDPNTYTITLSNGNTKNMPASIFETLFSLNPDQPVPVPPTPAPRKNQE